MMSDRSQLPYAPNVCLHEQVEAQAARTPQTIALESGSARLTYAALNAQANQLARRLRSLGVGPDVRVGLCASRAPETLIGLLAVLKAGGAYVPLDPAYPAERLAFMLADAQAPVLLTQSALAPALPAHAANTLLLDAPDWQNKSTDNLPPLASLDDLCYVIYTSGSTGTPKGVALPHRALSALIGWQLATPLGPPARTLQFASLSFDVSFQEIFSTWCAGGTLVLIDEDLRRDPAGLLAFVADNEIARLFLPFVALHQLAEAVSERHPVPSCLRDVVTAGEQLQITPAITAFFQQAANCRLHNYYGPSETHVVTAYTLNGSPSEWPALPPIGYAIAGTETLVLDDALRPVPPGVEGELYLGGDCLARGYLGRPDLTAERFVSDPFSSDPAARLYKTGDGVVQATDGCLTYLGRLDGQVKVRGFRVETLEVEHALALHPAVRQAAVVARNFATGDTRLVAYTVGDADAASLRAHLQERLPDYMTPAHFVSLDTLPLTPSGKVDRKSLPAPVAPNVTPAPAFAGSQLERDIAQIWREVLHTDAFGPADNFFDIGGQSLHIAQMQRRLTALLGWEPPVTALFAHPTLRDLARHLAQETAARPDAVEQPRATHPSDDNGLAIVGMSGRFPGAANVAQFWENIAGGVESIAHFSDAQLRASGVPESLLQDPNYVKARGVLDGVDLFDAEFFGMAPREAAVTDPQHRLFLECAWEALENAGYDSARVGGPVGVYAGLSLNTYLLHNLCADRAALEDLVLSYQIGNYHILAGNDKDFLPTRVSYKLNLTGPSVNVQTGCSTSLVAVIQAAQSLLAGGCDMALAGGVSLAFPQERGASYQEGGMASPDGHCRPFDAEAQGTVFGGGVGVVVLKRLADAQKDGDTVLAVLKGFGLNNDGSHKVSYTAPSVDGQAGAIRAAHQMAGVPADTISYVEAHGTATPLGDPIEVAALTQAFRASTNKTGFCALGSAKANVGHLEAAAGVTGLIKTVLALQHRQLPPLLHFETPNPRMDLERSPFYVPTRLTEWETRDGVPRRAGVSSFGVGGTNAHVVVEEAPPAEPPGPSRPWQMLPLSAKKETALDAATANLAAHFAAHPNVSLADAAYTLQVGRRPFDARRFAVCRDVADAQDALRAPKRIITAKLIGQDIPVAFLFPGQGAQQVNMGRALYATEPVFRDCVDECAAFLRPLLDCDLRTILYPAPDGEEDAQRRLTRTEITQPALFVVEYALAQLWQSWGVRPAALLGHSVGEFVAACLAGVFTLPDALHVLASRARLMQSLPSGTMLAVRLPEAELLPLLDDAGLSLAAANSAQACVVSGPHEAADRFEAQMAARGAVCKRLHTSHAFHSAMVDPILGEFASIVASVPRRAPQLPYVSNLTATWATEADATDPDYWARHLRHAVRFADGVGTLLRETPLLLLEVGPGTTLSALTRQHPDKTRAHAVVSSLEREKDANPDEARALQTALGRVWQAGAALDWDGFYARQQRRRIALPAYPFERARHWVDPPAPQSAIPQSIAIQTVQTKEMPVTLSKMDNTPPEAPAQGRPERLLAKLTAVLEDVSGLAPDKLEPNATFLELGFDSLFLTQASQAFGKAMGVKITFRNLLEDYPTLRELASHLDKTLPPDALPAPVQETVPPAPHHGGKSEGFKPLTLSPSLPPITGMGGPLSENSEPLARLIQQQLQLMQQQLALLGGQPLVLDAAPVPAAPPAPPAPLPQTIARNGAMPALPTEAPRQFGPYKPIDTAPGGGLTPRQQAHLDQFVARYVARTPGSKEFTRQNRSHLADPRVVANFKNVWKEMVYPIVVDRSTGSRLWDVDGNEWLDITMGFGVNLFGHLPAFVTEAVQAQMAQGVEIGPQSPMAGEVAKLICEMTGMERVTFCNTGSEAVMAALRVARTVTGRTKVAYFTGDYHGTFDEVLARANPRGPEAKSLPVAPGIPPGAVEDTLILDYGTPDALEVLKAHAHELAAVLIEPVQSRRPDWQPGEFLRAVRQLTQDAGAALIFDEVITGFRVHPGGAQAHFGVRADIATYGKVIGGGMPFGVVAGKAEYMDAFDGGQWQYGDDSFPEVGVTFFAGTFVRHPLALAAARAVLSHLKERGPVLQEELNARTARFAASLNSWLEDVSVPMRVPHFGSLFYLKFAPDIKWASLFYFHLRAQGVHVWEGRPCFLSTAHTDEDAERLIAAFQAAVREMQAGGFLPETPNSPSPPADGRPSPSGMERVEEKTLPLTEAQKEVWLAAQMGEDASCALIESLSVPLQGEIDVGALRAAVQCVVARHESLRATFSPEGDAQTIAPALVLDIPLVDLSRLDEAARAIALRDLQTAEGRVPFDLERGPLLRCQIVSRDAHSHVLVFSAHHLVCDGWSSGVILSELGALYSAARAGTPAALLEAALPAAVSFTEYARAEAGDAGDEVYWLAQLQNPPPAPALPTDRPRPLVKTYRGARGVHPLPPALAADLRRLSGKNGCTLLTTLLAGFSALLRRLTGQDDIIVGLPAAGQAALEDPSLVGHCVRLLPLRLAPHGSLPFAEHLKAVRGRVFDAYDHQNCTFSTLLPKLPGARGAGQTALVSVTLNVDRPPELAFAGLTASLETNPRSFFQFDLSLNIVDAGGALTVECDYNTDLFDAAAVARWLVGFQTLLAGAAAEPSQTLLTLPVLTEEERAQEIRRVEPDAGRLPTRGFSRRSL